MLKYHFLTIFNFQICLLWGYPTRKLLHLLKVNERRRPRLRKNVITRDSRLKSIQLKVNSSPTPRHRT